MDLQEAQTEKAMSNFIEFACDMNIWEKSFHQARMKVIGTPKSAAVEDKARNELIEIFNKYCYPKKADRRRTISLSTYEPVTYDVNRDEILLYKIKKDSIEFLYKKRTNIVNDFIFTMKPYKGEWKIYKAQYFDSIKEKWYPFPL